jgi:hypothetical protein
MTPTRSPRRLAGETLTLVALLALAVLATSVIAG